MRNDITSFMKQDSKSLYEAWERYKELLRHCPHHGLPKWLQVQTFYNGLSGQVRTTIDAIAGAALMAKSIDKAYNLLEEIATNNYQWPTERAMHKRVAEIHDVNVFSALYA
ncbi:Retrotransposon gag domain - like 10 [Theobroma cacao]|nr:Retrotransposon gag domain - like 10 [Theobroma cacao]